MTSFIQSNGDIQVIISQKEVTWFDIFYYSRHLNSNFGGWNSKSHWLTLGVNAINSLSEEVLKSYFQKSLKPDDEKSDEYRPVIRSDKFCFSREMSEERKQILVNSRNLNASENELNTWIFSKNNANIKGCEVSWKGYEIPLSGESSGQLKIDLVGIDNQNTIHIVELKKTHDKGTDSPLFAVIEVLCYGIQWFRCKENFEYELNNSSEQIKLSVATPENYWGDWIKTDETKKSFLDCVKKIMDAMPGDLKRIISPEINFLTITDSCIQQGQESVFGEAFKTTTNQSC